MSVEPGAWHGHRGITSDCSLFLPSARDRSPIEACENVVIDLATGFGLPLISSYSIDRYLDCF